MMKVIDGESRFGAFESAIELYHKHEAAKFGVTLPPLSEVADGEPVAAYVNHNRWVADCPDCRGAEIIFLSTPLFFCLNCCNESVGYKWRRLAVPENREEIERILMARPKVTNRNWNPNETADALRAENVIAGLRMEVET